METDDNGVDFFIADPTADPIPRNTSAPFNFCVVPQLSVYDVTLNEGGAGTTTFTFAVGLSSPAPAGGVTFDIATADGTATAGSDYAAVSLSAQVIPAGSTLYNLDVTVHGDWTHEADETFLVNVSNVDGATILDGQGLGTIINDDAVPSMLSIQDVTSAEGDSGARVFSFVVSLDPPAPANGVSFDIATADGTASAGSDYIPAAVDGVTLISGQNSYAFDVTVHGDTDIETGETFFVNVTNVVGALIADGQAPGTITNDDVAVPRLSIADLARDGQILTAAREIALKILEKDPSLQLPEHARLKRQLDTETKDGRVWSRIS